MTMYMPWRQGRGASADSFAARSYLFLQGPIGGFFKHLAAQLRADGQSVFRINFNSGDRLFWSGPARDFRGRPKQWPEFLQRCLAEWQVTDIVLFGDCRPLHRAAAELARRHGIAVHVFEEGYLRPNWITLELGGVNSHSPLPRDMAWYREAAGELPPWHPGTPVINHFPRRAAEDVLYNMATWLGSWRYPGYRTHKPWHPFVEYRFGARRFFSRRRDRELRDRLAQQLAQGESPYFLLPLQLEADSQIRFHSPFGTMAPAIACAVSSFARNAPPEALLVVTEHPLDSGVVDLEQVTLQRARAEGVESRVIFMRGGSTDALVAKARGVVTVNSTLGLLALSFGVPVKTMGRAMYNLPGLTCQSALDSFWQDPTAPDAEFFDCFRRVVAACAQVNGGLYSKAGVALAAQNAATRLRAVTARLPLVQVAQEHSTGPGKARLVPAGMPLETPE